MWSKQGKDALEVIRLSEFEMEETAVVIKSLPHSDIDPQWSSGMGNSYQSCLPTTVSTMSLEIYPDNSIPISHLNLIHMLPAMYRTLT